METEKEWGRSFITHDKILRDLRGKLDELERLDKKEYIEVEKKLLEIYGSAIYKVEKAKLARKK